MGIINNLIGNKPALKPKVYLKKNKNKKNKQKIKKKRMFDLNELSSYSCLIISVGNQKSNVNIIVCGGKTIFYS